MLKPLDQDVAFLAHYGVKGQKWGTRRDRRKLNRQKNRESAAKEEADRRNDIDKARAKVSSGQAKQDWKAAKSQYKTDKMNLGSREARKILMQKREKYDETFAKSQEVKTGKELAVKMAAGFAVAGAFALLKGAANA